MGKFIIGIIAIVLLINFFEVILGLCVATIFIAIIVALIKKICSFIRRRRHRSSYYRRQVTPRASSYYHTSTSRGNSHPLTYIELGTYGRQDVYVFNYEKVGSSWRAYIMNSPSYGSRASGAHATHRHYDSSRNLHYICFTPAPTRLEDITQVSKTWAKCTTSYIDTGKTF